MYGSRRGCTYRVAGGTGLWSVGKMGKVSRAPGRTPAGRATTALVRHPAVARRAGSLRKTLCSRHVGGNLVTALLRRDNAGRPAGEYPDNRWWSVGPGAEGRHSIAILGKEAEGGLQVEEATGRAPGSGLV